MSVEPSPVPSPRNNILPFLIAAKRLHGGVVDDLGRPPERCLEVEAHPARSQILRIGDWPIVQDRAWIADRHDVVAPPVGELPDSGDHLFSRHFWTGSELPLVGLAGREDFDVGAAHVDDQHVHESPRRRRARHRKRALQEHASRQYDALPPNQRLRSTKLLMRRGRFGQDRRNRRSIKALPAIAFAAGYLIGILNYWQICESEPFNVVSAGRSPGLHGTAVSEDGKRQHQDCTGESAKKS